MQAQDESDQCHVARPGRGLGAHHADLRDHRDVTGRGGQDPRTSTPSPGSCWTRPWPPASHPPVRVRSRGRRPAAAAAPGDLGGHRTAGVAEPAPGSSTRRPDVRVRPARRRGWSRRWRIIRGRRWVATASPGWIRSAARSTPMVEQLGGRFTSSRAADERPDIRALIFPQSERGRCPWTRAAVRATLH